MSKAAKARELELLGPWFDAVQVHTDDAAAALSTLQGIEVGAADATTLGQASTGSLPLPLMVLVLVCVRWGSAGGGCHSV